MRGRAMSVQASAEPTIGPTRPARSRTSSVLLAGAAPAALASKAASRTAIQRGVIANSEPRPHWTLDQTFSLAPLVELSFALLRCFDRVGFLTPLQKLLQQLLGLFVGRRPAGLGRRQDGLKLGDRRLRSVVALAGQKQGGFDRLHDSGHG